MPSNPVNDSKFLEEQYQDSAHLDARSDLHRRFSVNKVGWHRWVFAHLTLPPRCRILELGCGAGYLWEENISRIPSGWDITLSDASSGMLEGTWRKLEKLYPFQYKVIDVQSIPYGAHTFDAVIANHMLYHVPDRVSALREIQRVLAPGGTFYAATNGKHHLQEIGDLLVKFDPRLSQWTRVGSSFWLENGPAQLSPWFTDVQVFRYEDALDVNEAGPLAAFILSGWPDPLLINRQSEFEQFLAEEIASRGGVLHISKDSGLIVSVPRGAKK